MNFAVFFLDENGGKFETDLLDVSSSLEESVHTTTHGWFGFHLQTARVHAVAWQTRGPEKQLGGSVSERMGQLRADWWCQGLMVRSYTLYEEKIKHSFTSSSKAMK
jgi:hypothetical protein